jgi:hypothetical protein
MVEELATVLGAAAMFKTSFRFRMETWRTRRADWKPVATNLYIAIDFRAIQHIAGINSSK